MVLGGGPGWHQDQLSSAATDLNVEVAFEPYEALLAVVERTGQRVIAGNEPLDRFDAVLTRTMPAGSMESITARLSMLHRSVDSKIHVINSPSALEAAIDKYTTVSIADRLGIETPATAIAQDRTAALGQFESLGGDVVVKPIFGGEGRGVMRITERELARTVFGTLQTAGLVIYQQRFEPPGGRDGRVLILGEQTLGLRRRNDQDFRTNRSAGGVATPWSIPKELDDASRRLTDAMGLTIAAVDWIETDDGWKLIEVNAIPGWRSAQTVVDANIARGVVTAALQGV